MKKIYSDWSKEVKKAMIDRDLTTKDIAEKFHWTTQYVSAVVNGREYYREAVVNISTYLDVPVPKDAASTLAYVSKVPKKVKVLENELCC